MAAFYNENDPKAAAWLRELIKAGLIADGEVDERSITDVRPGDLAGFVQCHFFAGIGGWSYALRLAGWPDDRAVWSGSCPCQPFSSAGKALSADDPRHLWPAWFQLLRECRPPVVFGEQVASKDGLAWLDLVSTDVEAEDYAIGAVDLCAAGVGAPHIRQRLWFVAYANGGQSSDGHLQRGRGHLQRPEDAATSGMGYAGGEGLPERERVGGVQREAVGPHEGQAAARGGDTGALADAQGADRRLPVQQWGPYADSAQPVWGSEASALADDSVTGRPRGRAGEAGRREIEPGRLRTVGGVGESNGSREAPERGLSGRALAERERSPWADAEWIACRDGKQRPVEPGTFPLAHGVPARVGRLRGYGNAIVPPLAAEFIGAYMDLVEAAS